MLIQPTYPYRILIIASIYCRIKKNYFSENKLFSSSLCCTDFPFFEKENYHIYIMTTKNSIYVFLALFPQESCEQSKIQFIEFHLWPKQTRLPSYPQSKTYVFLSTRLYRYSFSLIGMKTKVVIDIMLQM